jgi:tetratricopeptide (TPR) repeat protein
MRKFILLGVTILLAMQVRTLAQDPTDRAGWVKLIEASLEEGKDAEALAAIRRAAKAMPDESAFRRAGAWFERHGDKRIKEKGHEAGLAVAERALKVLPADEKPAVIDWHCAVFRFWSEELLDKKDADGSLKVLARAYALYPSENRIHNGVGYHTQEAMKLAAAKSEDDVIELFKSLTKQFPNVEDIGKRGHRYTALAIVKLVEEKKFDDALKAVDRYGPLLVRPEYRADMAGIAYNGWALHLAKKKEYEPALAKYAEGLKAYPGQRLLTANAQAIADEWADPAVEGKKWDEAITIYQKALKYLPNDPYLLERKEKFERAKDMK